MKSPILICLVLIFLNSCSYNKNQDDGVKELQHETILYSCNNDQTIYQNGKVVNIAKYTDAYDYESEFLDYCVSSQTSLIYRHSTEDKVITDVDLATFQYFTRNYARDKNRVYIDEYAIINVGFASFKEVVTPDHFLLYRGMAVDKNYFYFKGEEPVKIDSKTFQLIPSSKGDYCISQDNSCNAYPEFYFRDKNHVYYFRDMDGYRQLTPIVEADSISFKFLDTIASNMNLFADNNSLYAGGKRLYDNFDASSWQGFYHRYFKDKHHVYYSQDHVDADPKSAIKRIPEADAATFNNSDGFYKDKNVIYSEGNVITFSDTKSLVKISHNLLKDEHRAYFIDATNWYVYPIIGADPNTIHWLYYSYFRDKNDVYYGAQKIFGADSDSFQTLYGGAYTKDKYSVYYKGEKIKQAKPEHFVVSHNSFYGKDENHLYLNGNIIAPTPEILGQFND